jgi:hypothetical protein
MGDLNVDVSKLPEDVREKLAELDLELSEGDITQKGYEKKRTRLLSPYVPKQNTKVRQEAVQQALAQAMQNRHKPSMPMPSKRTSVMARSPDRDQHDSESSSDEDSIVNEETVESTPEREKVKDRSTPQMFPPPPLSDTSSTGSPPPLHHRSRLPQPNNWDHRNRQEITDITDVMQNFHPYSQPPDVTHNTAQGGRRTAADRVNRYASSASDDTMGTGTGRWKVSAKIQQLLNTLKRPKRRPLPEFYEDDDIELEIAANPKDPNAPKPEGNEK